MSTINALTFRFNAAQAEEALRGYLCKQPYIPVEFVMPHNKASSLTSYLPIYVFETNYLANWHASFGYDRIEHYTEHKTETVNNVRRTTPITRTKTVTDWRPASGTARGSPVFAAYAGNSMPNEAIELMEGMELTDIVTVDTNTSSIVMESFTQSQEQVWTANGQARLNAEIEQNVRTHGQGDRTRDWSWNAKSDYSTSEFLFPMESIQIRFDGVAYNFWIDASNVSRITHAKLPKDARKQRAALVGFLPLLVILATSLTWWFTTGGSKTLTFYAFVLCCIAILGGFLWKRSIETKARAALSNAASGP